MPDRTEGGDVSYLTRIPADVCRADRVLGPLTARQTALLAGTGGVLVLGFYAARPFMASLAYLAMVTPIAVVMTACALGRREGIGMDRFILAALGFWRTPRRRVNAPEGLPLLPDIVPRHLAAQTGGVPAPLRMPCQQILQPGVVDLGRDGYAAIASCSTVNFDLRTAAEQQALTSGFARWLNSLSAPAQILIRAHRLDIQPLVEQLTHTAPGLAHPALEQAALAHASFLRDLATRSDLLTRQALLVVREPPGPAGRRGSGPVRVRQRIAEAAHALAAAGITATALDPAQSGAVLAEASNPDTAPWADDAPGPETEEAEGEGGEGVWRFVP